MYRARYLLLVLTVSLLALPPAASMSSSAQVGATASAPGIDNWNVDQVGHLGGINDELSAVVQAPYIYTAFGNELAVLDFSNPAHPTRIAYILLPEPIISMALADHYLYIIHGDSFTGTLSIIDIANPASIQLVGHADGVPSRSSQIVIVENHAYISYFFCIHIFGCSGGFQIWDISNRLSPNQLHVSYTQDLVGLFAVKGALAYTEHEGDLRIIDISDPAAPRLINTYIAPGYIEHARLIGAYAYVAWYKCEGNCGANGLTAVNGLTIVDLSNPANLRALGSYVAPGEVKDVDMDGTMAYMTVTSGCMPVCQDSLVAVDMSKPAAPRKRGLLQLSRPFHTQVSVANGYAFVGNRTGWSSINIARPDELRQVGFYGVPLADKVKVVGDYAYMLGSEYLYVVNISDPSRPYQLGLLDLAGSARDLDVSDNYAYITLSLPCEPDCRSSLQIVDISTPAAPRQVIVYDLPIGAHMVTAVGHYAYVSLFTACSSTCPASMSLIDITNPALPKIVGTFPTAREITGVAVAGSYAYLSTLAGLRVVDVSNPGSPREVGVYAATAQLGAVALSGSYAYVRREAGWQILDISSPAAPREVALYPVDSDFLSDDIRIASRYAYMSNRQGLDVVDIAEPAAPRTVGIYRSPDKIDDFSPPDKIDDFAVAGGTIYLAQTWHGLSILKFAAPRIAGRVADMHGRPFAGVRVDSSHGASATTDATGAYTFTNLFSGTFHLTPTLSGYAFEPPSRMITLPPNPGAQNFTILPGPVAATLRPGVASSLAYTDTQGLPTRLDIPSGSVTETLTLQLTPRLRAAIGGHAFAGHAFDLAVLRAGQVVPNLRFSAPVTATIRYSDLDVRVVSDKQRLSLKRWTGSAWQDASEACGFEQAAPDVVRKTISAPICGPGQFSLFGPTHQAYLPHTIR